MAPRCHVADQGSELDQVDRSARRLHDGGCKNVWRREANRLSERKHCGDEDSSRKERMRNRFTINLVDV